MPRRPNVPRRRDADAPPSEAQTSRFSGKTAWARNLQTPLREFLRTETGGAAVLLAAAAAALVWVNVDASSYDSLWQTKLSIRISDAGVIIGRSNTTKHGTAFLYKNGVFKVIAVPNSFSTSANGISANGLITGTTNLDGTLTGWRGFIATCK